MSILVVSRVLAGRHKDLLEEMSLSPSPAPQHRGTADAALLTPDTQSLPVWSLNSNKDIKCCFLFTCLLALESVGCTQIALTAFIYFSPTTRTRTFPFFFFSQYKPKAESLAESLVSMNWGFKGSIQYWEVCSVCVRLGNAGGRQNPKMMSSSHGGKDDMRIVFGV